jgi:hypothetical protein
MQDARQRLAERPFDYQECKNGSVRLLYRGKTVKTLAGNAANRFLNRAASLDAETLQLLLARETGQFKFGNERAADAARR